MKKTEIIETLSLAYRSFREQGMIKEGTNVGKFLVAALEWDLSMRINFYFEKTENVARIAEKSFNFAEK